MHKMSRQEQNTQIEISVKQQKRIDDNKTAALKRRDARLKRRANTSDVAEATSKIGRNEDGTGSDMTSLAANVSGNVSSISKQIPIPRPVVDTNAGFFLEDEQPVAHTSSSGSHSNRNYPKEDKPNPLTSERFQCLECQERFLYSFLSRNFGFNVCDGCRDDRHKLITKTNAKQTYLIKDADLDRREPRLSFISRKNPHNDTWGEMRLYLESQVRERALIVWESWEALEEAKEKQTENRQELKQKKFDKKLKDLRMSVRSSLWTKDMSHHQHSFLPEVALPESEGDDMFCRTCSECKYTEKYEKM